MTVPGLQVRLLCDSGGSQKVVTGRLLDISATGVRLLVNGEVAIDELLLIETRLTETDCLNLSARVAWIKPHAEGVAIGCRLSVSPAGEKLAELRRLARASA